jgi:hypothetical protein
MLALALVFSVLFSIFALILGGLVGWTVKQHLEQKQPYTYHPEMFDEHGQVIPDELIAFRFEHRDYVDEEEDLED